MTPMRSLQANRWSLIFFGVGVGSFICTVMQQVSFGIMGTRLARRVRVMLFDALLKQEVTRTAAQSAA